MAHPSILVDTSIIIEHLRKQNRRKSILYDMVGDYVLYIATIVEFELYAGAVDTQKQQDIAEIVSWCNVLPFTTDVARTAATIFRDLRTANQLIEIRDIFIAATALTYDLSLVTLNLSHFNRIDGLRLHPVMLNK